MSATTENIADVNTIRSILEEVKDPEVPVLSIRDLGVLRNVEIIPEEDNKIRVTITPTYSGCPAMDTIRMDIKLKLLEKGFKNFEVVQSLSPAWTTDWMTEEGKKKLKDFGIAPPNPKPQFCTDEMFVEEIVECPRCHSPHTKLISQFGSTACKSMYVCNECREAFDYFKCH